jgi:hypothetical protein
VHDIAIVLAATVPVQLCGPVTVILSSLVTVPLNPLKGAPKVSEHPVCVTTALCPMSEGSQWAVTFHVPLTSGHEVVPPPAGLLEELELHARRRETARSQARAIER